MSFTSKDPYGTPAKLMKLLADTIARKMYNIMLKVRSPYKIGAAKGDPLGAMGAGRQYSTARLAFKAMGTALKNSKGMKLLTGVFKSLSKAIFGATIGFLLAFLDKFVEMCPIFQVLSSLFTFFVGQLMVGLMPVLTELIEILTSPEMLAFISELATYLALYWTPALKALVWVLRQLKDSGALEAMTTGLRNFNKAQAEAIATWRGVESIVNAANRTLERFLGWMKQISSVGIAGGYGGKVGGGTAGAGKSVGSAIGSAVKRGLKAIGIGHSGIPSVPQTGLYLLQRGERVETPQQNQISSNQMEEMLLLQHQIVDYQEKSYKLLERKL